MSPAEQRARDRLDREHWYGGGSDIAMLVAHEAAALERAAQLLELESQTQAVFLCRHLAAEIRKLKEA